MWTAFARAIERHCGTEQSVVARPRGARAVRDNLGPLTHRRARNRIRTAAHRCARDRTDPCENDRVFVNSWTGDYAPLADVRALLLGKLFSVSLRTRPVRVAHDHFHRDQSNPERNGEPRCESSSERDDEFAALDWL